MGDKFWFWIYVVPIVIYTVWTSIWIAKKEGVRVLMMYVLVFVGYVLFLVVWTCVGAVFWWFAG